MTAGGTVTAAKIDDATLASLVARIEALEARSAAAARAFGIPEEH